MNVRVRFAPSPTGNPHVGNFRTALYNYLFARHHQGDFLIRIEDTDEERSEKKYEEAILESLQWMGLELDEPPYHQSLRIARHQKEAHRLLAEDNAYRCRCTPERLDALRAEQMQAGRKPMYDGHCRSKNYADDGIPFCVRMKTPLEGATVVEDPVRGNVVIENQEMDDLVILRTNGSPTYNFAVVVDDHDMEITHVIRGDDHLNNTARQVILYQSLGYEIPRFIHLPQILGSDRTRLSKRHGATGVLEYRDQGYLPEALINYLARLGWAFGDQEFFTKDDLIRCFMLENVNCSPAVFDPQKLLWLNGEHIRALSPIELAIRFFAFAQEHGYLQDWSLDSPRDRQRLDRIVEATQERSRTLAEMLQMVQFLFTETLQFNESDVKKMWKPEARAGLEDLAEFAAAHYGETLSHADWEAAFGEIMTRRGLKMKILAQAVRLALTGSSISPPIFHVMDMLGIERVEKRLRAALAVLSLPA